MGGPDKREYIDGEPTTYTRYVTFSPKAKYCVKIRHYEHWKVVKKGLKDAGWEVPVDLTPEMTAGSKWYAGIMDGQCFIKTADFVIKHHIRLVTFPPAQKIKSLDLNDYPNIQKAGFTLEEIAKACDYKSFSIFMKSRERYRFMKAFDTLLRDRRLKKK